MDLKFVSGPTRIQKLAVLPVADLKAHARIDASDEDTIIERYIVSAYDFLSGPGKWLGGTCLLQETWDWWVPSWDIRPQLEFPIRPLMGNLTAFESLNADGSTYTTVPVGIYSVVSGDAFMPGRAIRLPANIWPYTGLYNPKAYHIRLSAGFGTVSEPQNVPEQLKLAMALLASHWFNNRESVGTEGREPAKEIAFGLKSLAGQYRIGPDHS